MLRIFFIFAMLLAIVPSAYAQQSLEQSKKSSPSINVPISDTLTGTFYNDDIGLRLHVDLGKERLIVPGMAFLGPVFAYMDGRIYGSWMLVKKEVKNGKAILRFTNEIGSDSQDVELTQTADGNYFYRTLGGNNVKKVVGRRLVKIADSMPMKRRALDQ